MNRTMKIALALVALSSTALAKSEWDSKGAADAKAAVTKLYEEGWNKMDLAAVKASFGDEFWTAWDLDMAQQPIAWGSKAELFKFLEEGFAELKKMGATASIKLDKVECKASGMLAICTVEGTQNFSMPKMPPMAVQVRASETMIKDKSGWKWFQHHGSAAKDALPIKFMATSTKATNWIDAPPEMPGVKILPLWMDAANMWSASVMKATQEWKQPRHIHPYPFTFTILEGSLTTTDASGKATTYGPGSVVFRSANEPHETTVHKGFVGFMVAHGPMMQINVDDKGQPIKQAQK